MCTVILKECLNCRPSFGPVFNETAKMLLVRFVAVSLFFGLSLSLTTGARPWCSIALLVDINNLKL